MYFLGHYFLNSFLGYKTNSFMDGDDDDGGSSACGSDSEVGGGGSGVRLGDGGPLANVRSTFLHTTHC